MRTIVTPEQSDWDVYCEDVQMVINNSVNETIGESPHYLLYGYSKRLPVSLLDDARPPNKVYNYEDYISRRIVNYYKTVQKTRENMKKSQNKWAMHYRSKEKNVIKVGTQVYVKKMVPDGPNTKLSAKFAGPYRVLEVLKNNKFKLIEEGSCKETIQHYNNLKMARGDSNWELPLQENGSATKPLDDIGPGRYQLRPRR